ncbi:hypothetical protein O0L34_g7703 [Tuta absoluta]|nr:hypothetical protein O0L34_g7703 [Tuta absoluta]
MRAGSIIFMSIATIVTADFYSDRYDNFDVEPLLENDRILVGYTRCFLDQGPCTAEAKDFKKVIPEALETTCGKCTLKQRQLIRQVIRAMMEKQPEAWKQLVDRFDHDHEFQPNFNKFIQSDD